MRAERRRLLAYEAQRLQRKGRSQRQIAKVLQISRRTVKKLLDELEERRTKGELAPERELGRARIPKPSKLDEHDPALRAWLKEFPKITAVRCHEKLCHEEGFEGGYTIVRDRVRELRAELVPPKPTATPVVTAPGQRAEFDWSPYTLDSGDKVQLWNATLRWSRAPSLAAASNSKQTTTLRLLRQAFEEWQGVPRECLTDSMPGVVDRWECDQPILNVRYVDFAAHYGYTALIAPRRAPTWKAVAERLFRFHEGNLLNGRKIRSLAEYYELLAWWKQAKGLGRDHPEQVDRSILEMLILEREHLERLPAQPYDTRDVVVRVVDDYQRVRFETNHYPAAPAPVGSRVYVCADQERIEICDHLARHVAEHERLPDGARVKLMPRHKQRVRYDLDELVARLAEWGSEAETFARGVREARRYAGAELSRLLQLQVNWSLDDLVAAMHQAATYHCYEVAKVQRILEARYSPRSFAEQIAESTRRQIRAVMRDHPVRQRSLESYGSLQRGDRTHPEPKDERNGEEAQVDEEDGADDPE